MDEEYWHWIHFPEPDSRNEDAAKPRMLLGRCRRLGRCGYIDCICDVDPTDPRDMAALREEEKKL